MAAATAVTGAAFGAAFVASGVYLPAVILDQLKWENCHMLQAFLTATAASAIITTTAQKINYTKFSPRSYADRGWFAPYDGNVVGGLALGAGMALSGACPGTVLAQVALGIRSGYYALGGGLLGGTVWAAILRPRIDSAKKARLAKTEKPTPSPPVTIQALAGVSTATALVGLEVTFAAIVGASLATYGPGPDAKISPVVGGLIIGLVQLFSVAARKSLLGVSTVYEDVGDWLLYYATSSSSDKTKNDDAAAPKKIPAVNSITLSLAIYAGAWAFALLAPQFGVSPSSVAASSAISPATAALGGFTMAIGSRVAGGCTSGHGISGMSLFSISSYITMASAFVGGGLVALLL
ncbi:hypothetical protein SPBR_03011 [Sporothrix brasiliensis 5110]|uniref:Uncharacterized protein n=1 Tax=Sporothrix brasiliensis 5110 TaxID=1398154 RepID=A0A0C2IV77_9PEZI|nr:uncharacterized protein SPBR_03011 [Sporothrix brasiliensis 5110]KIH93051.1 hypothetical protein SPBR_03011 [Sporothrix brasiliensis 5110]